MDLSENHSEPTWRPTTLHELVEAGDLSGVDRLLRNGAEVNQLDGRGATALHVAAARGHLEIARLLVERGAEVDLLAEGGATPLASAAANMRPRLVQFLLSRDAQSNKKGDGGLSPLHCTLQPAVAAKGEQLECIRLLVASGASIDERTNAGSTPLMKAAWFGNPEAAEELLRLGANPALCDARDRTAAALAFERGHDELAKVLAARAKIWPMSTPTAR